MKVWQLNGLPAETGPISDYSGIRYLTVRVNNIESVVSRARDSKGNIPIPPRDVSPGIRRAIIEDPDGNWFELVEFA